MERERGVAGGLTSPAEDPQKGITASSCDGRTSRKELEDPRGADRRSVRSKREQSHGLDRGCLGRMGKGWGGGT
eukprot:scaffold281_cov318-Pavlova_lutheri.AAC.50